jgi:hypothetical protein
METKHFIIIGVVVVLALGYFGFQHFKGEEQNQVHREDTYRRMIDMAQKSPRHGLAEMGMLISRYYNDHKAYPPDLDALYPDYITSMSFIEEIKWSYEPESSNFYLSKTVVRGGREMIASIDKKMRAKIEGGVMVASADEAPVETGVEDLTAADSGTWIAHPVAPPRPIRIGRIRDTGEQMDQVRRVSISEREVVSVDEFEVGAATKVRTVASLAPEMVSVIESEIASIEASDVSARYLVWKDDRGALGFGNISYPRSETLSIARRGKWYGIKRKRPESRESSSVAQQTIPAKKSIDQVAADLRGWSLVWKNSDGYIGFGNVGFPVADRLSISAGDRWVNFERREIKEERSPESGQVATAKKDIEEVAEHLSDQFLVWKDASGTVGIGNVEYPDERDLSINTGKGWDIGGKKSSEQGDEKIGALPLEKEKKDFEDAVSQMSGRYIMWKDKNGTVGFGNVEYPDLETVSYVHDNNRWKPVAN